MTAFFDPASRHFAEQTAAPVAKLQPLRKPFRPFSSQPTASVASHRPLFSPAAARCATWTRASEYNRKKVFTPFTAKAREPIVARRLAALTCWPKFTAPHAAPQLIVRTHAGPKIVVPIAPLLCDPQKR